MKRLLLDTHAFLWWIADDARLSTRARAAIVVAQALIEDLAIVSADPVFRKYGVKRIW